MHIGNFHHLDVGTAEVGAEVDSQGIHHLEGGGCQFIEEGDQGGRDAEFGGIINERFGGAIYSGDVGGQIHVEFCRIRGWDWRGDCGESDVAAVGCARGAGEYECAQQSFR